jgi:hypothetical protein
MSPGRLCITGAPVVRAVQYRSGIPDRMNLFRLRYRENNECAARDWLQGS